VPSVEPLNTLPIQQFIQQVKQADAGRQKELRLTIDQAKNLAFTLGSVMARMEGDLEKLVVSNANGDNDVIQISMDAGAGWK
jgi:hypothetical protein